MDWNTYWESIKDEYINSYEGEDIDDNDIDFIKPHITLGFNVQDIMDLLQRHPPPSAS